MAGEFGVEVGRQIGLEQRLQAALGAAGLRATRTRRAVYGGLAELGGHRSADEVYASLTASGVSLARTTVYSALAVLARAGAVMAADAGPGRALFEASTTWHHHVVCRECSKLSDIECAVGSKPCLEAYGDWGEVDEAQVIFRGICRECLERSTENDGHRRTRH